MIESLALALLWYILLTIFGLAALPVSMIVFRRLPDAGLLLARPLGWLSVGVLSWYLAYLHMLPFSRLGIVLVLVLLFAFSYYLFSTRMGWVTRRIQQHWRTARNGEAVFILVFLLLIAVRLYDHNIDSTEKPMDAMMLSSLVSSREVPPLDDWMAGETINYHYGGYLLHSLLIKLSGVQVEYGYNLSIAAVAATAASIAFVLGRALFGRCRYGVITVIGTLFVGNLASVVLILNHGFTPMSLYNWRHGYLWKTSRVIYDQGNPTINEYPFFTLLWGDVHPHFSNLPFLLLFITLTFALGAAFWSAPPRRVWRWEWPTLLAALVSAGFILPTNIFDFPVCALLFGFVILSALIRRVYQKGLAWREAGLYAATALLPGLAYLLAAPFWLHFQSPLTGPKLAWVPVRTELFEFLMVFGAHLALTSLLIALYLSRLWHGRSAEEKGFAAAVAGIVTVAVWTGTGSLVYGLALLIALLTWVFVLTQIFQKSHASSRQSFGGIFALIACALAWSIILGCETVYIPDNYAAKRMNTMFKFHFAAWLLFGIGLPAALYHTLSTWRSLQLKPLVYAAAALIALVSITGPVYTLSMLFFKNISEHQLTLNGLRYLQAFNNNLYEVIVWVRENTEPHDRLVEIPGAAYSQESLVSAFTGRPSIIGWVHHENLWRAYDPRVGERENETNYFFTTQNAQDLRIYTEKYQPDYVVFVQPNNQHTLQRLSSMMQGVFRQELPVELQRRGNPYHPNAPYEVYRIPEGWK